jgi:hypothetical protein
LQVALEDHRRGRQQQRDAEEGLGRILDRRGITNLLQDHDPAERGRDRADAEPPDQVPSDGPTPDVDPAADGLHRHRGDEIRGNRGGRVDAEEDQEDRGHERAPAHPRQPDREAHDGGGEDDPEIDVHGPSISKTLFE